MIADSLSAVDVISVGFVVLSASAENAGQLLDED